MRILWTFRRRLCVAVIVAAVVAVSSAVVLVGSRTHSSASLSVRPSSRTTQTTIRRNSTNRNALAPTSTSKVPQSALQRQIDAELAQAETPAAITAAQRTSVPAPDVSTAYPSIATADRSDPSAYAIAFVTELLDTNYAVASREGLLAWAEHEEAPNTLPGVPADVAGKALVLSLGDPDLPGGSPSPVPSAAQWVAETQGGVSQSVTDVQAEVDPDWTQIISQGWQPHDPLMTVETVTGTLTVETKGVAAPPQSFSLSLTLGSAAHARAGYGAVAVTDWTLN
jgi:hypothetical protein